jgi:ankyrin repeat protein
MYRIGDTDQTALHVAAETGNVRIMYMLLHRHVPSMQYAGGMTPLHRACIHGQVDAVKCLLRSSGIAQATQEHGASCLHIAVLCGHAHLTRWLLNSAEMERVLDSHDHRGRTPLFLAAALGKTDMVRDLIRRKANIHEADSYGSTPIFAAVRNGHADVIQELLEKDWQMIATKDGLYRGHNLLYWAKRFGNGKIVAYLEAFAQKRGVDLALDAQEEEEVANQKTDVLQYPQHCDICVRRLRCGYVKQCTKCCGGSFYMCSECCERVGCPKRSFRDHPTPVDAYPWGDAWRDATKF